MSSPGATAFVGRVDELQRLRDAAAALARGQSSLVLVEGEAGAGKTRLLTEVTHPPFLQRGHVVAFSGALDYARAPYAPIRDLLLALDKRFPKVLKNDPALSSALRPVLALRPPFDNAQDDNGDNTAVVDVESGAEQRRVVDAVVEALTKFTAASPAVLAIEDIHWIDRASADVLVHVSRNLETLRALVLVSFRGAEAQDDEQARYLLGQLGRAASVSLSLAPLSRLDALVLIEDVATAPLPMDMRRHISELADGNPLLLIEFTKLACDDPNALRGSLPLSLKALVAERLNRFNETDVDVLRVAAAMGEFDPATLAEIADIPAQQVISTLRKARSASIIGEPRSSGAPFIFRHALIRHAITEDLLAVEVAGLHRRIGERLEAAGSQPAARLAYHFWQAGDAAKLERYNETAGDEAFSLFAFTDSATYYERAINSRALSEETFDLYGRWADACTRAHRSLDALRITEELFAFAAGGADGTRIGTIGFELSRRRYAVLDDDGAVRDIKRTLDLVDAQAYPSVVFNLHATHAWYLAHLRRVEDAGLPLANAFRLIKHADREALVRYYEAAATNKVHSGNPEGYRQDVERALEIARGISPVYELRRADTAIALSLASNLDDMEYTLELCDRVERIADQCNPAVKSTALMIVAWPRFLSGDFAGALRALDVVFAIAEDAPMVGFFIARTGIPLALHLDDPLLLRRCVRPRILERAFSSDTPNVYGPVVASVSEYLRGQGREDEAKTLLLQAIKRLPTAMNTIPIFIEAARAGSGEALKQGLVLLEQIVDCSRSARGALHLCRAYAARGEERRAQALEAAGLFGEIRWHIYEAEALELAEDRPRALELYRSFGSIQATRRLESNERRRSDSGLSAREWQVAQLVAQGKSNRLIASELVLSERTIENHIASIFAKLKIGSRAEIAAAVARSENAQV